MRRYRWWAVWTFLAVLALAGTGFFAVRWWRVRHRSLRPKVMATILYRCGHELPATTVTPKVLATLAGKDVGSRYAGWKVVKKDHNSFIIQTTRSLLCPRCRRLRFLGVVDGVVAVYEGTPLHPGRVLEKTGIQINALPPPEQADLRRGIPFTDTKERLQLLEGLAALVGD